jgi:hypothetical protein
MTESRLCDLHARHISLQKLTFIFICLCVPPVHAPIGVAGLYDLHVHELRHRGASIRQVCFPAQLTQRTKYVKVYPTSDLSYQHLEVAFAKVLDCYRQDGLGSVECLSATKLVV